MKDNKQKQTITLVHTKTENNSESFLIKLLTKYQHFIFKHKFLRALLKTLYAILEIFLITFIVITISFFLIDSAPGKPAITSSIKGPAALAIEAKYHLNDPSVVRWANYINGIFHLNFGISMSIFPGVPINDFIWERFWTSAKIGLIALVITLLLGVPLGVLAGKKITGFSAFASTMFIAIMISIPSMVFGLILLLLGRQMGIPYIYSGANVLTWLIPAIALSLGSSITYIKYIRTTMNDEIVSQHAKFAKLKGASNRRFIWKHALKPSLFPVATFFPASILFIFMGGLFIEKIFMIPGSGFLMTNAAQSKDTYIILLLVTIYTILTILAFRLRDWLYSLLDPRVRKRGV